MNRSETIQKLAPALLQAQKALKPVVKDSENPHFRSKYAGLPAILEAAREACNAAGIVIIQGTIPGEPGTLTILTTLLHESGEFLEDSLTLKLSKDDAQGVGSAYTYGRRYALQALVGLAAEDDDDGNAASAPPKANGAPPTQKPQEGPPVPRSAPPAPKETDWKAPMLKALSANLDWARLAVGEIWIVAPDATAEDLLAILAGGDDATRRKIYKQLTAKEGK